MMGDDNFPLLHAGNWSWENVKDGVCEYLANNEEFLDQVEEKIGYAYYLTGEKSTKTNQKLYLNNPSDNNRVQDSDLNVPLYMDIDSPRGYIEKAIEFQLDVTFDQLCGDSLQLTRIKILKSVA